MLRLCTRRSAVGRLFLAVLVAAVVRPAVRASAADLPETLRESAQTDHDRQVLKSLDFLLALSLNREQARAVIPMVEKACRLRLDAYERRAEVQREELEAYAAFLAEDRLNQGFSKEVERRTARTHHQAKKVRESLAGELNALTDGVYDALHPAQQEIADTYEPKFRAVFDRFATQKDHRKAARRARRARRRAPQLQPPRRDPQLTVAKAELDKINKAIHPHENNVAKFLLSPAAAEPLYELAGKRPSDVVREAVHCWRFGTREVPLELFERDRKGVRELRKQINHWNLANGMHFDSEQIEQLVYLADQTERLRTAQHKARPRNKLPRDAFNAQLVNLELAAESVLRPGQLEVLETYKPCLIPPKNLKNPVRVGQASDSSRLSRWLDRARRKNDRQVERMIDGLIEGEIAHLGPMDGKAVEQRRETLEETVRTASRMSDVDFALNRNDLGEAIQPENRKDDLVREIDDTRRDRTLPGRTSRFLLKRDFAVVLTERYAQLVHGVPTAKTNLAAGLKAADCAKSCAVRREKSR